ncbi:hypothetical protein [uncultured Aquimarina sp.]|uniref:hypothetical protein n=1 Tax=uncultured Aquimarina sp. TaxID=575652 RepID=UPI002603EB8C|nr:hypothetical protein [uncultured Aquimarina sp.]
MSGHKEGINAAQQLIEARSKRIEEINRNWADYANQTTFATNESEEGLIDAYFAKNNVEEVSVSSGNSSYPIRNPINLVDENGIMDEGEIDPNLRTKSIDTVAQEILSVIERDSLLAEGYHTNVEAIRTNLEYRIYREPNNVVEFEIFKKEERVSYEKKDNGILGEDSYILVKGFALKDKEATVEIFERSPFLLMEDEIPLTVIQYDTIGAEEPNENTNKTELKAIFNDQGEAVVKIKFRPKVDDPDTVFEEWKEKFKPKEPISLPPPSVEEMQQITPSVPLTFGSDVSQIGSEVSTNPEDYPLPTNQKPELPPIIDFLWLKVKVSGDKQDYEEEFLNESERSYFRLERNQSWAHSQFGNLIARFESRDDYNLCNRTFPPPLREVRDVNVVGTPISEIQRRQSRAVRTLFAVGRYQVIPKTMNEAVAALNLDVSKNFDEETQDRVFNEFLIDIKRPPIIAYLEGDGDLGEAMYSAAKEWASIGVEIGRRISNDRFGNRRVSQNGESYYAGDGLNRAHITPEEIREALINSKNGL